MRTVCALEDFGILEMKNGHAFLNPLLYEVALAFEAHRLVKSAPGKTTSGILTNSPAP
jgi:hypothetical protein